MLRCTAAAIAVFALAASGAGAAPQSQATHGNPAVFLDQPLLDALGGAPEIFVTNVMNTTTNVVRFSTVLPNRASGLTANDVLAIFVDSDRNFATGVPNDGSDYAILVHASNQIRVVTWNGTAFVDATAPSARASANGPIQDVEIAAAELGGTSAFHFYVYTQLIDNADAYDASPSAGNEVWVYPLGAPHVDRVTPRFAPARPRAGRPFRVVGVQLTLSSEETVAGTAFRCSATLAGRRLRGTGAGGCRFALPRTARGKRLVVTVTVDDQGEAKASQTTFRVSR